MLLFGGEMPPADKAALVAYLRPDPVTSNTRIRDAIGLALGVARLPVVLSSHEITPSTDCNACAEYNELSRREFLARTHAPRPSSSRRRPGCRR